MGLDDRCRATGRDSGECPETVTYIRNANLVFLVIFTLTMHYQSTDQLYLLRLAYIAPWFGFRWCNLERHAKKFAKRGTKQVKSFYP